MSWEDYQVSIPEGTSGDWVISKFTVNSNEFSQRLSMMKTGRGVPRGLYTRLSRNGKKIMSDTPDEILDHMSFIRKATGNVLIAGLGLGVVLDGVARKQDVKSVTVIEQSEDVIKLVREHYQNKYPYKIAIIQSSIFDWKPKKTDYFDWAWYDIWDDLCTDNIEQMKTLHRKFGRKTGEQGSWGRHFLERQLKLESYW